MIAAASTFAPAGTSTIVTDVSGLSYGSRGVASWTICRCFTVPFVSPQTRDEVTLTDFDPEGEVKVVAAALYAVSGLPDDQLLEVVRGLELFAGFCYTQFADTYQEANGLLYADRTPKFPIERIAAATTGLKSAGP